MISILKDFDNISVSDLFTQDLSYSTMRQICSSMSTYKLDDIVSGLKCPYDISLIGGDGSTLTLEYYTDRIELMTAILVSSIDDTNKFRLRDTLSEYWDMESPNSRFLELDNRLSKSRIEELDDIINDYNDVLGVIIRGFELPDFSKKTFRLDSPTDMRALEETDTRWIKHISLDLFEYLFDNSYMYDSGILCSGLFPIKRLYNSSYSLTLDTIAATKRLVDITLKKNIMTDEELFNADNDICASIVVLEHAYKRLGDYFE